jgi:hypothetical protein
MYGTKKVKMIFSWGGSHALFLFYSIATTSYSRLFYGIKSGKEYNKMKILFFFFCQQ